MSFKLCYQRLRSPVFSEFLNISLLLEFQNIVLEKGFLLLECFKIFYGLNYKIIDYMCLERWVFKGNMRERERGND